MSTRQITQKKLKAIVFTDMADFTIISAQDEENALELIQKQNEIIKPIVEKHNGEWLKELGDGLLFSFDSSLEAVRCSIQIQETLKDIDDLNIRIGIHQGDIFIKDGDVFGDDVNIASRVEGFAPIGGISLSDKVHKDIAGVSDIKTSFIGHRKLKGVEQETKIRCIISHNLPKHKMSRLPVIASYLCFMMAIINFMATILYPIAKFYLNPDATDYSMVIWTMIVTFVMGSTYLLFGYSTVSFTRGLSVKSQRLIVYLAYVYIMLPFVLAIFNTQQQAIFAEIGKQGFPIILGFLLVFLVFPTMIIIAFRKKFGRKK